MLSFRQGYDCLCHTLYPGRFSFGAVEPSDIIVLMRPRQFFKIFRGRRFIFETGSKILRHGYRIRIAIPGDIPDSTKKTSAENNPVANSIKRFIVSLLAIIALTFCSLKNTAPLVYIYMAAHPALQGRLPQLHKRYKKLFSPRTRAAVTVLFSFAERSLSDEARHSHPENDRKQNQRPQNIQEY